MFSSVNKTFWLLQQNFWLQQQKKIFVVPNFVAVTKPFFSVMVVNSPYEIHGENIDV